MKNIQSVNIWVNGEIEIGTKLQVSGAGDDYSSRAVSNYKIYDDDMQIIAEGNIIIEGEDYINWGNLPAMSINEWIYNWVAQKLNLVII